MNDTTYPFRDLGPGDPWGREVERTQDRLSQESRRQNQEIENLKRQVTSLIQGRAEDAAGINRVTWNDILGVPSTFPPTPHTHTSSQIVDLASQVWGTENLEDGAVTPEKMSVPVEAADVSRWNDATEDTGFVDISASLASGFSGPFDARRIGDLVDISGTVSGAWGTTSLPLFASGIPTQFLPTDRNRWGVAYRASGAPGHIVMRPNGTMSAYNFLGGDWGTGPLQINILFTV